MKKVTTQRLMEIRTKCFNKMVEYVRHHYSMSEFKAQMILHDYQDRFGHEAIIDLYAWLVWCEKNSIDSACVSIGHDLGERKTRFMSPRTGGYGKEVWGDNYEDFVL